MYDVTDSYGNSMRVFKTYQEAANYKQTYGNKYWNINFIDYNINKALNALCTYKPNVPKNNYNTWWEV